MTSVDEAMLFLQRRGTSLERVAAAVEAVPSSEAVLLVGSVAEGLANGRSDIDLLHLGDSDIAAEGDYLRFDAGGAGLAFKGTLNGLRVQVESLSTGWLDDLAASNARRSVRAGTDEPRFIGPVANRAWRRRGWRER